MRTLTVLALTSLVACGTKDDTSGTTDSDGTAAGTATATATGTGTGAGPGTGASTGTGTGTTTTPDMCTSYKAVYDLTGSTMFIDAAFDFEITVQEPYDADENAGPGTLELRFTDAGGAPGDGVVHVRSYRMTQDFTTGIAGVASVHTDLQNVAADRCGVASGTLAGTTLTWNTGALDPHCQTGEIACTGPLCGTSGSPPEGKPVVYDNECGTLEVSDFTFSADLLTFTMELTQIDSNTYQTTSHSLMGTATEIVEEPNTPECMCP